MTILEKVEELRKEAQELADKFRVDHPAHDYWQGKANAFLQVKHLLEANKEDNNG